MKTIDMDSDTKQMLQEISATMGVKNEIVREVWEFTIFTILLNIAEKPEGPQRINIPYFGHLLFRDKGLITNEKGEAEHDIDILVGMSENFKKLYLEACQGQYSALSEYLQENYIKPVLQEIK